MNKKFILFCNLSYSFSILRPIEIYLQKNNFQYIWFIPKEILKDFPFKDSHFTVKLSDLKKFQADAILVTGNNVPYNLKGVKVQIFHGLAGEKKGHFRIRGFFDIYLTQGKYFTDKFKQLAKKYKNFEVIETGWAKLDPLFNQDFSDLRNKLLTKYQAKSILLYAPTFSPSLTSANKLLTIINKLSLKNDILLIIKFHDKMDKNIIQNYKSIKNRNLLIWEESNILPLLKISDLMVSDTSSVVYEFLFLDKPIITFNSNSENILWENVKNIDEVENKILEILIDKKDNFQNKRKEITNLYHPYNDGNSSQRVINAVLNYIEKNGVPRKRKISLYRKLQSFKLFPIF